MQKSSAGKIVYNLYRNEDGSPIELTHGQEEIFDCITARKHPRVQAICYTQYGKTLTSALAVLTAVNLYPEKYAIVAPSNKKAQIMMGYVIDHIFDNEITYKSFQIEKGESEERIKRERRKDRINFKLDDGSLGEVFILSSEGKRTKDVLDALMGFGAKNILLDESSLIDDLQYDGILRMLGGHTDNFLFEIGNPMRRNHFYRTSRDENYHHIMIDAEQGIKEGRITREFIEEMRRTMNPQNFKIFYECQFPDPTAIDESGYSYLVTEADLDRVYCEDIQLMGSQRLLVDVGAGGNYSTIVHMGANGAKILYREKNADTMSLVGIVIRHAIEIERIQLKVLDGIFVDKIGVGQGVYDRLMEDEKYRNKVFGVNNGEQAENKEEFVNVRAESYWRAGEAVKSGFKLVRDRAWEELLVIKWKVQSDRRIRIKPKEEMLKEGIPSPDVADALALGFSQPVAARKEQMMIYKPKWKGFNKR